MHDTTFVVWDRRGRLAADTRHAITGLPAKVVAVDDETEFRETLAGCRSAVVILERSAVGENLPDVIVAADFSHSRVIVVGMAGADEVRRDRDLGAHLLIPEPDHGFRWSATIRRMAAAARSDLESATAIGRHRR